MISSIRFTNLNPEPFGNPPVDLIRAVCTVLGILLICWIARVVKEQHRRPAGLAAGQMSRFAGLALLAAYAVYGSLSGQGAPMTWALPLNIAGLVFSFHGIHAMRREQKGPRP